MNDEGSNPDDPSPIGDSRTAGDEPQSTLDIIVEQQPAGELTSVADMEQQLPEESTSNAGVEKQTTGHTGKAVTKRLFRSPQKMKLIKSSRFPESAIQQTVTMASEALHTMKTLCEKREAQEARWRVEKEEKERDEYNLFGQQISMKIRTLEKSIRPLVQFKINQILFEAETGQYNYPGTQNTHPAYSPAYYPPPTTGSIGQYNFSHSFSSQSNRVPPTPSSSRNSSRGSHSPYNPVVVSPASSDDIYHSPISYSNNEFDTATTSKDNVTSFLDFESDLTK